MKKIPTLFERQFSGHKVVGINSNVTPGCEFVLEGKGVATVKIDGACCAIIDGKFYRRYDAKGRKKVPAGSIPCCDPDPVTGHWPHWAPVSEDNPSDKWFVEAYKNSRNMFDPLVSVYTLEAMGPQGALVNFRGEANAQHLIDTMRKRLCFQASKETREYAEDFKQALHWVEPELAEVLVPNCVYRGGCPEMKTCGYWTEFLIWCHKKGMSVQNYSIQNRYVLYNQFFEMKHGGKD